MEKKVGSSILFLKWNAALIFFPPHHAQMDLEEIFEYRSGRRKVASFPVKQRLPRQNKHSIFLTADLFLFFSHQQLQKINPSPNIPVAFFFIIYFFGWCWKTTSNFSLIYPERPSVPPTSCTRESCYFLYPRWPGRTYGSRWSYLDGKIK